MDKKEFAAVRTDNLSVGYGEKIVVDGVDFYVCPGKTVSLIGPNGGGKSTILKTITRQIENKGGTVFIGKEDYKNISGKEFAKTISVMLTKRPNPEYMTCFEVVAMGRFPYTDTFGSLKKNDLKVINEAMELVGITKLSDAGFDAISDGQKQRVMLARAIAQSPKILIMDEPTTYLDIKYKIEFISVLRKLKQNKVAIILSIHELELAKKISDEIICVGNGKITAKGTPESIFVPKTIGSLYGLSMDELKNNFAHIIDFSQCTDEKTEWING